MAQLPLPEAIERFKGNEERTDIFNNGGEDEFVTPNNGNPPYRTQANGIKKLVNVGGMIGAANATALQAIVPTYDKQIGLDEATGNLWRWDGSATPPAWVNTGRNLNQDILNYIDADHIFNPILITSGMFTNVDDIKQKGIYVCDSNTIAAEISGLPTAGRAFILLVITENNQIIRQELSHLNENFVYFRTSFVTGELPAFGRMALKSEQESFTVSKVSELKDSLIFPKSDNLYDSSLAISGERITGTGSIGPVAGAKRTGYIPIEHGKKYTISWNNSVSDNFMLAFFDSKGSIIGKGYREIASVSPIVVTAPYDARYLVFNLKHGTSATERTNVQVELGETATAYKPYSFINWQIFSDLLPKDDAKDYENVYLSKNLFDESQVRYGKYLASTGTGINTAVGWACSGFIPVLPNTTYVLSGTRSRVGIQAFVTNTDTGVVSSAYIGSSTMPLAYTTPSNANFIVFNLQDGAGLGWSNIQFEIGATPTKYIPYQDSLTLINPDFIDSTTDINYTLSGGVGKVVSKLDDLILNIGVKLFSPMNATASSVFNFNNDLLGSTTVRLNGDDAAPVRMMGYTIGANHGYSASTIVLANHGKTSADIGSVWTDGTQEWVIINVVSVNVITITARVGQALFTLHELVHVSGATNTASFTPTSRTGIQWYPMLKNYSLSQYIDDSLNLNQNLDVGFSKNIKIAESYDLMVKEDIVEWIILNKGQYLIPYQAASALKLSMCYTFDDKGTCLIPSNFFTYKEIVGQDLMFTQAGRLSINVDGPVKYYVPRSIAFTHESQNFNFSIPTVIDNLTIANRINFDAAKTESGKVLPDRLIMLNNTIGFAIGYLPILDAAPEVRNTRTSKGIQISESSSKVYPYLVDGLTTVAAHTKYSAIAYRKYFKLKPNVTAEYIIESEYGDYVFLDWHNMNQTYSLKLSPTYIGKPFEVVEKSDNVTILSDASTGVIDIAIGSGTSARLVIKF